MNKLKILFLLYLAPSLLQGQSEKVSDPIRSFENYWEAFDLYESDVIRKEKNFLTDRWNQIKQEFKRTEIDIESRQIEALKEAIRKYQDQLARFATSDNRPYVMMNLAYVNFRLGKHYKKDSPEYSGEYYTDALRILADLVKQYPAFEKIQESMYLRAIIFSEIDQEESASKVWKQLSESKKDSLFKIHAMTALGDGAFYKENASSAHSYYKKAFSILAGIENKEDSYEKLRLQYRIAWAAYRSAKLSHTIEAGIYLLQPTAFPLNLSLQEDIRNDACDLIADALFEYDDWKYTRLSLSRNVLREEAGRLGLRLMNRYHDSSLVDRMVILGEFLSSEFPSAAESPAILSILAEAYNKNKNEDRYLAALERLALMLPSDSLWRLRNQRSLSATELMEEKSLAAAILLASFHYERGMKISSVSHFETAQAYFDLLIDYDSNHKQVDDWRLKKANSLYFSEKLDKADAVYTELIEKYEVKDSILQVASYQRILTREKILRNLQRKTDFDAESLRSAFSLFEAGVLHFANRFAYSNRVVEVLLLAAAISRDIGEIDKASRYWQRVLVSNPNSNQRGMAIRGLVFSKIQTGESKELVETTKKYLGLENWEKLGSSLGEELRGILSTAVDNSARSLYERGKAVEAGQLILSTLEEQNYLPEHERLYRDASYMLAIGGDWLGAYEASASYLANGSLKAERDDMMYLRARSLDYQLDFRAAAQAYFEFAQAYPKHKRSQQALERSSSLSQGESNWELAAKSSKLLGEQIKSTKKKFRYFLDASGYFDRCDQLTEAKSSLQSAGKFASSEEDKFSVEVKRADLIFRSGEQSRALSIYADIKKHLKIQKENLDGNIFRRLMAEVQFNLAKEEYEKFIDFKLTERSGNLDSNFKEKSKLFSSLVEALEPVSSYDEILGARSRFLLGEASEVFSEELGLVVWDQASGYSAEYIEELQTQAKRLIELSKSFHTQNVLAWKRNPKAYVGNMWMSRSFVKVSGDVVGLDSLQENQQSPVSLTNNIPYQWSL